MIPSSCARAEFPLLTAVHRRGKFARIRWLASRPEAHTHARAARRAERTRLHRPFGATPCKCLSFGSSGGCTDCLASLH
eukprot:767912-Pleurochrysis_carterae.AAC.1